MNWKKIVLIVGVIVVAAAIVGFTVVRAQSGYTKVVTGKVVRQDLVTQVSGTGQIKPKTYVNLGATAQGRITHFYAKEGDHVKRGQVVATIENVQQGASVEGQKATLASAKTDIASYVAAEGTAAGNVEHAKADLEQKQLDFQRAQSLYKEHLIAKQDFDAKKAAYDLAVATLAQSNAAVTQAQANTDTARGHMKTAVATLRMNTDQLNRTIATAPFDGIVTNQPLREGETVVMGIQNTEGSTLMTLADMSIITAEVKVDETDIVNVRIGQLADVTADAVPGKVFKGHVTLVGDQALLRSSGVATSQSTSGTEEAKDFKVVVTLDAPSEELRPGLSATAKITTAHQDRTLSIPIQALTMHSPDDGGTKPRVVNASTAPPVQQQGVYVVRSEKGKLRAVFVPVTTGITGTTDIQVTSGLEEGQELVVGPYKVLRSLKSGAPIKRETAEGLAKSAAATT